MILSFSFPLCGVWDQIQGLTSRPTKSSTTKKGTCCTHCSKVLGTEDLGPANFTPSTIEPLKTSMFIICTYVYGGNVQKCRCQWSTDDGVRAPGAAVSGSCELPNMGCKLGSYGRAASLANHWAIALDPQVTFKTILCDRKITRVGKNKRWSYYYGLWKYHRV